MKSYFRFSLLFVAAGIAAIYCLLLFNGFPGTSDAGDYAALARNIAGGNGFVIGHAYPLSFAFFDSLPLPNHMWAPAYPLYLAIWFLIFGADDLIVITASIVLVWMLVVVTYFLGKRTKDETFGLIAAALVCLSQIVLNTAIDCSPEILCAALLTISLFLLRQDKQAAIAMAGIAFGAAVLSRYQIFILIIPLWIFYLKGNFKRTVIYFAALLVSLSPWLIYNWMNFSNPFFTLQSFGEFTKGMGRFNDYYYTYRSLEPITLLDAITRFPWAVLKKFIGGLVYFAGMIPVHFNFLGIIPFVYGILKIRAMKPEFRKLIGFTACSLALIVFLSSLGGHHHRYLVTIQPILTLAMLLGFYQLVEDFQLKSSRVVLAILIAVLFLPLRAPFQESRLAGIAAECSEDRHLYQKIAEKTPDDTIIFSDVPDGVWWYSNRKSIWIPINVRDIVEIQKKLNCEFIYLRNYKKYLAGLDDEELLEFLTRVELISVIDQKSNLYRLKPPEDLSIQEN